MHIDQNHGSSLILMFLYLVCVHNIFLYVCLVQFLVTDCLTFVERSKQGKKSDGNFPMTRFHLVGILSFYVSSIVYIIS